MSILDDIEDKMVSVGPPRSLRYCYEIFKENSKGQMTSVRGKALGRSVAHHSTLRKAIAHLQKLIKKEQEKTGIHDLTGMLLSSDVLMFFDAKGNKII